jgi:hypothetical protein
MRAIIRFLALVLTLVLTSASQLVAQDFRGPNDDWIIGPEKPKQGLAGPRNAEDAAGWVYLGRSPKSDGDPASYAEKKVKCGDDKDNWCTVTLVIGFHMEDAERLKITHTGSDGQKREAFLKDTTDAIHAHNPSTHEYTVSVKGCAQCTLRVEIIESAKSKKPDTQSVAHVKIARIQCTEKDRTNAEGRLVDQKDEKLPRPD